jgi:hypothetical protein
VEGEKVNREGEGGRTGWVYFINLYENRIMKPVRIVLSRRKRENDGGSEPN